MHISDEFKQCVDSPQERKKVQFDDINNDVWKSCRDLEIDG